MQHFLGVSLVIILFTAVTGCSRKSALPAIQPPNPYAADQAHAEAVIEFLTAPYTETNSAYNTRDLETLRRRATHAKLDLEDNQPLTLELAKELKFILKDRSAGYSEGDQLYGAKDEQLLNYTRADIVYALAKRESLGANSLASYYLYQDELPTGEDDKKQLKRAVKRLYPEKEEKRIELNIQYWSAEKTKATVRWRYAFELHGHGGTSIFEKRPCIGGAAWIATEQQSMFIE